MNNRPSLLDHPDYASWVRVRDELDAKQQTVRAEIESLRTKLDSPESLKPTSIIDRVLALVPGEEQKQEAPVDAIKQRLGVLRRQEQELASAAHRHQANAGILSERAATRLFGHVGQSYLELAEKLLAVARELGAANDALLQERNRLYTAGVCAGSIPDVLFPEYGLHSQLPTWCAHLEAQVRILRQHVEQAHPSVEVRRPVQER